MGISRKQRYAINHATARVNIWDGAIRSGKTHSSLLAFLKQFTTPLDDGVIVITGKNADSIYRNVFAPIFSTPALEWAAPFIQYRQGANTARIFGRTVHVIGANDERAENRIRGMTVRLAYMDEITVLPENFFRQLLGRMSPPGAQLFATTNPDSPSHWFKKNYLDRYKELGWQYFHFEMDDNPALSEEYKNSIKAEYTGLWYDRFILGRWTAAEGAVFSMWNETTHIVEDADLPAMLAVYAAGIDYGTTNPTSAILLGHGDDDRLYLLDEWRIDQTNRHQPYTDAELVDSFHDWHNRLTIKPRYLTVDPAAASFKAALYARGYRNIKNGDNDVNYGLKLVSNLLATDRLKVTRHCTGFLGEVSGYVWDSKESAKGHDKPVKQNDHSIDAARYAITTTEALWHNRIIT